MRIVAGRNKGKRLKVPKKGIRPTKGLVREAIFNVIGSKIMASSVLDIFAGSGALGLEALSRGAGACTFIEHQPRVLMQNITTLQEKENSHVIKADFHAGIKKIRNQKYNIIFLDPPYRKKYVEKTLSLICKYALLHDRGIIVVEHSPKETYDMPDNLTLFKKKTYGDSAVHFLIEKESGRI
jgi:16S rRNA (guanine(966)-N(2))-methyltransferase RsmD